MVKTNLTLLFELCNKGFLEKQQLKRYFNNKNAKNLRSCLESMFNLSLDEILKLRGLVFEAWESPKKIWSENEILIFGQLLRMNGVATVNELYKKSKIDKIEKVRDAVIGLEENETNPKKTAPVMTTKSNGNSKIVFISPKFVRKMLK